MKQYEDSDGEGSIFGYDEDDDSFTVYYKNGLAYVYTMDGIGEECLNAIKCMAHMGFGLHTCIKKYALGSHSKEFYWPGNI
jgi:hypothetical protein